MDGQREKVNVNVNWRNLGSLEGVKGPQMPQPVEDVPAVSQPMLLRTDEWVCAGCWQPIVSDDDGSNARIEHNAGCPAMAAIGEQVKADG